MYSIYKRVYIYICITMYRYNYILFVDFFIYFLLYMGFIANAIKRMSQLPEIDINDINGW